MANGTSLEDYEIALIKTMIRRKMKNASIQFYFNRPDRPVNNGRISEIKNGDRGAHVKAAYEFEVDEFINRHQLTRSEDPVLMLKNGDVTLFNHVKSKKRKPDVDIFKTKGSVPFQPG